MHRTYTFCAILGLTTLYYLFSFRRNTITSLNMSSQLSGWYARTTTHSSPDKFVLKKENLQFIILRNAQVDTDGFTLAVFKDHSAIDARGRLLTIDAADFDGLVALANKINELPEAGGFRNAWRVDQPRTSQPIERLLIGDSLKETDVQGWSKDKKDLKTPVGDIKELPDSLFEFVGLVLEAREGWERGKEGELVEKAKKLVE